MRRYSDQQIQKAKELRQQKGYSFAHLQKLTRIPATTIRNWCADDYNGSRWDTLLRSNARKREELKSSEISAFQRIATIDSSTAKIFVALLYGCEGYKYPSSNKVGFTNTDPYLLRLFVGLLRKAFVLDESKFRVHVQIHDTHDYKKVKKFWSDLLNISEHQFIKPTVTKAKGGKHRRYYLGTCTVRYYDFRIQLKLTGIYEEFLKRFGEVA